MFKLSKNYYPYVPIVGMGFYLIIFSIVASNYTGGSINVPTAIVSSITFYAM